MADYEISNTTRAKVYGSDDDPLIELERSVGEDGDERVILTVNENMLSMEEAKLLSTALIGLLSA